MPSPYDQNLKRSMMRSEHRDTKRSMMSRSEHRTPRRSTSEHSNLRKSIASTSEYTVKGHPSEHHHDRPSRRSIASTSDLRSVTRSLMSSPDTDTTRSVMTQRSGMMTAGGRSMYSSHIPHSRSRADIRLSKEEWKALASLVWYHGMMPRNEIEELLTRDGDYLVRKSSDVDDKVVLPLSVRCSGRIRHVIIKYEQGSWWLGDPKQAKKSLKELIEHYVNTKQPIFDDGTVLQRYIPRPGYYIPHEQIELGKKLGNGAFGEVFMAKYRNQGREYDCAVKVLKGDMAKKKRVDFIKEARLMRQFNHENIVQVYGVAPQQEPLMIVLELSPGGSLKHHLKGSGPKDVPTESLIQYCFDAACGMQYLASQNVIHRDVAARNCLLGRNNEVKISDFGLSVLSSGIVTLTEALKLPIRWLSPETLDKQQFSTKSDVWSFGVLMWEVFSRCSSDPYPGLSSEQARNKIMTPSLPMEAPAEMPPLQETLMRLCFIHDSEERATFNVILRLMSPDV